MIILLVLLLGVLLGGLVSHRVFAAALTSTSRRTIKQLEDILDGLAIAHQIELSTLEAECELQRRPQLEPPPNSGGTNPL